jgi:hypothetical protein
MQYLNLLRSDDQFLQIKAAKDFYAFLLNELKQVKRDDETSFVDNLIHNIKDLAHEANPNTKDKQACIYIITAIINLDSINVKVRKKHHASLFRILRNLLACPDPTIIHMASRAMGRYVQAGVECDVEFKSGLELLKRVGGSDTAAARYQGILLVRELVLAYPPRLFLHSATFFENIVVALCDSSPQIRYEAIELFRLSLVILFNRETATTTSSQKPSAAVINSPLQRNMSTSSNMSSSVQDNMSKMDGGQSYFNAANSAASSHNHHHLSNENDLAQFKSCFAKSLLELAILIRDYKVLK